MSGSQVFFRFRDHRDQWTTCNFDAGGVPVVDMKRVVASLCADRMSGPHFEIRFRNVVTGEEYLDNNFTIPRSSCLEVRKIPAPAGHSLHDLLAEYEGKLPDTFEGHVASDLSGDLSRLNSMINSAGQQSYRSSFEDRNNPNAVPPSHYICHRCGKPGHYIRFCPTNGDSTFNFKKVKPKTGLPGGVLQPVEDKSGDDGFRQRARWADRRDSLAEAAASDAPGGGRGGGGGGYGSRSSSRFSADRSHGNVLRPAAAGGGGDRDAFGRAPRHVESRDRSPRRR